MAREKILSVSVDLDPLSCYFSIHGLPQPPERLRALHYTAGLARLLALFADLGLPATLFAVGRDLGDPGCARILAEAAAAGHEPANHTFTHPYDLTRLPPARVDEEIGAAHEAIARAAGRAPAGFRAPGYHMSDALARALGRAGYRYDASLLPSPPYYLAKLAVMGLGRLAGRESGAIAGGPGMLAAPAGPYRMAGSYWRRGGGGLLELPCSVASPLRIPVIGTSIALLPPAATSLLLASLARRRFVSLELHAVDLMDGQDEGLGELSRSQPDLRVPAREKERRLRGVVARLAGRGGFAPATLERAANILTASGL